MRLCCEGRGTTRNSQPGRSPAFTEGHVMTNHTASPGPADSGLGPRTARRRLPREGREGRDGGLVMDGRNITRYSRWPLMATGAKWRATTRSRPWTFFPVGSGGDGLHKWQPAQHRGGSVHGFARRISLFSVRTRRRRRPGEARGKLATAYLLRFFPDPVLDHGRSGNVILGKARDPLSTARVDRQRRRRET